MIAGRTQSRPFTLKGDVPSNIALSFPLIAENSNNNHLVLSDKISHVPAFEPRVLKMHLSKHALLRFEETNAFSIERDRGTHACFYRLFNMFLSGSLSTT